MFRKSNYLTYRIGLDHPIHSESTKWLSREKCGFETHRWYFLSDVD